jgi:hypothetical protein
VPLALRHDLLGMTSPNNPCQLENHFVEMRRLNPDGHFLSGFQSDQAGEPLGHMHLVP